MSLRTPHTPSLFSSTIIVNSVIPSGLFEDGNPVVVGFNQRSTWQSAITRKALGGHGEIGRFMTKYAFPVILRASDLPEMRASMARNLGVATFEEAFHMMCSVGPGSYSQFDIILNYMWYNRRDGYSWHIADPKDGKFDGLTGKIR